jgi:Esterase-like activity of phytase
MGVTVEQLRWTDIPLDEIALPKAPLRLTLGLGSGLSARGGRLFAVTDRGPNLHVSQAVDDYGLTHLAPLKTIKDAKVLPLPDAGPEIAELRIEGGGVRLLKRLPLRTRAGTRLSAKALPGVEMEEVYGLDGKRLQPSVLGADTEAVAAMPGGGFFVAEEYGPSLLKVSAEGVVSERWVAKGREGGLEHAELAVRGVLPERVAKRRLNRGFEALCASGNGAFLYVGMQSGLEGEDKHSAPVWKLDARTGQVLGEWAYAFDAPDTFLRDAERRKVGWKDMKVCEFVWAGLDRLIVLERIAHSAKIYLVDLAMLPGKRLLGSSDEHREIGPDIEGMALVSPRELVICSDNDFGVEGKATGFWRIALDEAIGA